MHYDAVEEGLSLWPDTFYVDTAVLFYTVVIQNDVLNHDFYHNFPIHKLWYVRRPERSSNYITNWNRGMDKTYIGAVYMMHDALSIFVGYNTPTIII